MKKLFNKKGMTLIEVVVSIVIFAIIIQVGYSMFFTGNKSFGISRDIGFVQQDVRNISTFINSELRYIDKLSTAITDSSGVNFTGIYYSIGVRDNGDQTYSLVRKKYDGELPFSSEEIIITTSTKNNPFEINISNTEEGKINVIAKKIEGGQEYSLDFDIGLENNRNLKTDVDISLYDFDTPLNNIYYSYPADYVELSEETN